VPAEVWDTRDPRVVAVYLDLDGSRQRAFYDTHGLTWATGQQQIGAWTAARFKQHHRFVIGQPRAAGDTVTWPYQEFVDPFQRAPGFSPGEGDAAAVVRGGRIARLSLVQSPASAERQRDEADAFLDQAVAAHRTAPLGTGSRVPLSGPPRTGPPAEQASLGWPLALGGLALLAAVAGARRRRRGGTGDGERNRTTPAAGM
jgi:hypothetical protein